MVDERLAGRVAKFNGRGRNSGGSITLKLTHSTALAAALAVTVLAAPAQAAPATGPNPIFTGSDLFNLEVATDPQISPDGRTIA